MHNFLLIFSVFRHTNCKSSSPREAGDIERVWSMVHTSIVDTAVRSSSHKVVGPLTKWWAAEVKGAIKLKKESK